MSTLKEPINLCLVKNIRMITEHCKKQKVYLYNVSPIKVELKKIKYLYDVLMN